MQDAAEIMNRARVSFGNIIPLKKDVVFLEQPSL